MAYRVAADAVLVLHLGFIVFALFGAALALRWRWLPLVHLPAAAWGFFIEITGRVCPLTWLENRLRQSAGQAGYSESFIEHYLVALIYPSGLTREVQFALAGVVLAVNAAIYTWLLLHRRSATRQHRSE